jgi:hypothetical protein
MSKAHALHASLTILLVAALGCGVREERRQTTTDTTAVIAPDDDRGEYQVAAKRRGAELTRIDSLGVAANGLTAKVRD